MICFAKLAFAFALALIAHQIYNLKIKTFFVCSNVIFDSTVCMPPLEHKNDIEQITNDTAPLISDNENGNESESSTNYPLKWENLKQLHIITPSNRERVITLQVSIYRNQKNIL